MNATSQDIKDMLEAESSLSLTYGIDLFIGEMPVDVDNCVVVFDAPSSQPHTTYRKEESVYYYENVQITVRNRNYLTAIQTAQDIRTLFHARAHETWSSTYYSAIFCTSGPANLGPDENQRSLIVLNFQVQRR